jgi:ubiquinone/menaquinone biosynthesis C-methylase UbiE
MNSDHGNISDRASQAGHLGAYSGRAEDYARYRPAYAEEAVAALIALSGISSDWIVADVGSGTGILSEQLIQHCGKLIAIEPNDDMREQAESSLLSHPRLASANGTAENTGLPDKSIDLITAGQALHWFEPSLARVEFARILRPPMRIAAVWNQFEGPERPDLQPYFEDCSITAKSYSACSREPWESFIGGARSASFAPLPESPEYAEFEASHREVFESRASDGLIEVRYTTELVVGRLRA